MEAKADGVTKDEANAWVSSFTNSHEENQAMYSKTAGKYDEFVQIGGYSAPKMLYENFAKLELPKESRILDCGAGTGMIGYLLQEHGYRNIDALDANADMLEVAKRKVNYKNTFVAMVGKDRIPALENETYDAVLCSGSVAAGHITIDGFPELIRCTKTGGFIMWFLVDVKKHTDIFNVDTFTDGKFDADVQHLCDMGQWKFVRQPTAESNACFEEDCTFYTMQKI